MRRFILLALMVLTACGSVAQPGPPQAAVFAAVRFPAASSELWLFDDQGRPTSLISPKVNAPVCWLPNGDLVFTMVEPDGPSMLMRWTTTDSKSLVRTDDGELADPACHPQRDEVVFWRRPYALVDDEPSPPVLWRWNDGQGGPLHEEPDVASLNAAWNSSGDRLAFEEILPSQLVVRTDVAQQPLGLVGTYDWSPDGQQLVVSRLAASEATRFPELVLVDIATGAIAPFFLDHNADVYFPRWSPDGSHIAFIRRPLGAEQGEVWVVPTQNPTHENARQITNDPAYDNFDIQWSPDSQRIMWTRLLIKEVRHSIWQTPVTNPAPAQLVDDAWWGRWL